MRNSVVPDTLRALIRQLQQSGQQLNQAMGSHVYDAATLEIIMNKWGLVNLQGEQIVSVLMEMANTLQVKVDQFQTVDDEMVSNFHNSTNPNPSLVAMFGLDQKKHSPLLSGFGQEWNVVSNPSTSVVAIVGEGMRQDTEFGCNWEGPSAMGWSTLGYGSLMIETMLKRGLHVNLRNQGEVATKEGSRSPLGTEERRLRGTLYTLTNAAQNPQVYKFIDPKFAAKEVFTFKEVGVKLGYAGRLFDTGVEGYNDYQQVDTERSTASMIVSSGVGLGTWVGNESIAAAVGVAMSAVTEININGKSLKTHAFEDVDRVIDGMVSVARVVDEISDSASQAAEAVSGTVDTISRGASKIVTRVNVRVGALTKMFS
ncbi:hypothetical protein J2T13_005019 [Paenibacillus sp. DS2015]|uniref:hypothetical protein n=1 Tax=Paenibacillus sp. DS2015 TaxID=3373917 RepID=UPI003D1FAD55